MIEPEVVHADHAIRYDDVQDAVQHLTPEEQASVERRMKALDLLLSQDKKVKAKYKVELRFGKARSIKKLTPGMICWWESGSKFRGGGDDKLYLCPSRRMKKGDCEAPIPNQLNEFGMRVCPSCGGIWALEDTIGELAYNLPMQRWAQVMLTHYLKFEQNADLVLKFSADDLRSVALQRASFRRSENLDLTRARRAILVYPLRNIIKDVSNGADLYGRIYAFLTA